MHVQFSSVKVQCKFSAIALKRWEQEWAMVEEVTSVGIESVALWRVTGGGWWEEGKDLWRGSEGNWERKGEGEGDFQNKGQLLALGPQLGRFQVLQPHSFCLLKS